MFQRGAPAPQWPSSRHSQDSPVSSETGVPSIPFTTATPAANVAVVVSFRKYRAKLVLPLLSVMPSFEAHLAWDLVPKPLGCSLSPESALASGATRTSAAVSVAAGSAIRASRMCLLRHGCHGELAGRLLASPPAAV